MACFLHPKLLPSHFPSFSSCTPMVTRAPYRKSLHKLNNTLCKETNNGQPRRHRD